MPREMVEGEDGKVRRSVFECPSLPRRAVRVTGRGAAREREVSRRCHGARRCNCQRAG